MDSQLALVEPDDLMNGQPPQHICSSISAAAALVDERRAQTDHLEYELAVDVALALAVYDVTVKGLSRKTGLSRRRLAQLVRMSAR